MLRVVIKDCIIQDDRSAGKIVVESDCTGPPYQAAFTELDTLDARKLAQGYAASVGIAPAHINGNVQGPYPVNSAGTPLEDVRGDKGQTLPPQHPLMQPKSYRIDVPVCRPLR
jgi:hypothetical protein